jgi:hypothetical protein
MVILAMYGPATFPLFDTKPNCYDIHKFIPALETKFSHGDRFDTCFRQSEFPIQTPEPHDGPNFRFTNDQNFKFYCLNHVTAPNFPYI